MTQRVADAAGAVARAGFVTPDVILTRRRVLLAAAAAGRAFTAVAIAIVAAVVVVVAEYKNYNDHVDYNCACCRRRPRGMGRMSVSSDT